MATEAEANQGVMAANETVVQPKEKKKEEEIHEMTTLHERSIAALSYIGPLAIVPFYLKKDSAFCRFHGKQGMVLMICFFISQLFSVLDIIMDLMLILQVILFFYMGMAALSGKWTKAPLIYDFACKLEKTLSLKTPEEELEGIKLNPGQVSSQEASMSVNQGPPEPPTAPMTGA